MSQPFGRPSAEIVAIPYVDDHTGPRRVLTINLTSGNATAKGRLVPVVSIDGRQYIVYWGPMHFEIPADRPCHVSVHVDAEYMTQAASTLLPPAAR